MSRVEEKTAPDLEAALQLELNDQHGRRRRLGDFRGHNVILYFYPMDDTPGCTVEGREFRDLNAEFEAFDSRVIGVSTDSVERHHAFAEKHRFPFVLLSDPGGRLARVFGVLRGERAARSTFVIDRELRMRRAFFDVTPRGHAGQVLNFIRNLVESHRMLGG